MMLSPRRYMFAIICSFLVSLAVYIVILNVDLVDDQVEKNLNENYEFQSWNLLKSEVLDLFSDNQEVKTKDVLSRNFNVDKREKDSIHRLHLSDYLSYPWAAPYDFNSCRMSTCFNFSRCHNGPPLKVHILRSPREFEEAKNVTLGESNLIHKKILEIIRNSKHYEPDPEKACIFLPEDDTLDRDPLSKSFQSDLYNVVNQDNNYGMNYLIFNLYSGTWPDYKEDDFAGIQFGASILAKASNSVEQHRPEFDIALPLFSYLHPMTDRDKEHEDNISEDVNTTYFLTFKGKRYVFGRGSETRNSLYHLNNEKDIILLTTCRHGKKWRESSDSRCADDETKYKEYDFLNLMEKSTFCLIPRGRRLGSFRYLEALSHGCIPIILSDSWVKPFDELIDWSCASIQIPEVLLLQVPDMLRDLSSNKIKVLRRNCLSLYHRYFSSIEKIIMTTLSILERRVENYLNK